MEANRPQKTAPVDDAAKVPAPPAGKAGADARRMTDGEMAQPLQQLDPAHRLSTPSELREETAHGHSPLIPWPAEGESQNARPFKNMK
jgi:hypothetical protein